MDNPTTSTATTTERRRATRGPRTCQEHGICKGRYPNCGRCDDDHPEDEPPAPGSFEQIWTWLWTAVAAVAAVALVGIATGYFINR